MFPQLDCVICEWHIVRFAACFANIVEIPLSILIVMNGDIFDFGWTKRTCFFGMNCEGL